MVRRELNEDEKRRTQKAIDKCKTEMDYYAYQASVIENGLRGGYEADYNYKIEQYRQNMKKYQSIVDQNKNLFDIYNEHLTLGVEEKEKPVIDDSALDSGRDANEEDKE